MEKKHICLALCAVLLACIAGIVYLVTQDKNGWGWLVFISILIVIVVDEAMPAES